MTGASTLRKTTHGRSMRARGRVAGVLCMLLSACSCDEGPTLQDVGDADASTPMADGTIDASADSSLTVGSDATQDSAVDGSLDAGVDASVVVTCPCPSSTTCMTWVCNAQNVCEGMPTESGTTCGESNASICVEGACVTRRCGDGYREIGPSPAAERCDDGNGASGDGCSSTCVPEQRAVAVDSTGESDIYVADGSQAIGIDGQGRALIVWARDEYSPVERTRLFAGRYRANGAALDAAAPLMLDANLIASPPVATPAVAGLPDGGWVVAWTAFRAGTYDIVYRLVGADGTLGAERIANQTRQSVQKNPALAALDSGFVIAWQSAYSPQVDPDGGVYARRFTSAGSAIGSELALMSNAIGIQANVALASRGASWIAVWTDQQLENNYVASLRMRRFASGTPSDPVQQAPFSPLSAEPSVVAFGTGYLVAYRTTHVDPASDIEHLFIPETGSASSSMPTVVSGMTGVPEHAPSLVLLDDTHFVMGLSTAPESVSVMTDAPSLPAEWSSLISALASTSATRVSLARSAYGLWVVWQSNGLLGGGYGAAAWFWPSP